MVASIFIDAFVLSWANVGGMIFLTSAIGTGGDLKYSVKSVHQQIWKTQKVSWHILPFTLFILYAFIPMAFRSVADNFFDSIWTTAFSYLQHQ